MTLTSDGSGIAVYISKKAWDVVVTTFTYHSNNNSKCDVTEDVTNVTSIFTERFGGVILCF